MPFKSTSPDRFLILPLMNPPPPPSLSAFFIRGGGLNTTPSERLREAAEECFCPRNTLCEIKSAVHQSSSDREERDMHGGDECETKGGRGAGEGGADES